MIWKIELSVNGSEKPGKLISIQIDTGDSSIVPSVTVDNEAQDIATLSFQEFMKLVIKEKKDNGHLRTSECYTCALNSFEKYLQYRSIYISEINNSMINGYESYLKDSNICKNSISFYMRILKAVYNMAVKRNITTDVKPFTDVYTGVAKTRKRSLDIDTIRRIKQTKLQNGNECLARDLFLFSFYTRGMAFVDMAYLQRSNLQNGMLIYTRRKTGLVISIKWEKAMQDIVNRYKSYGNNYLLPIIRKEGENERNQYRYIQYQTNKHLRDIGKRMGLDHTLTMYVARHSWASIAKSIDVPLDIIRESLGHTSEKMTSIYLKTIDESRLHRENERIIQLLDNQ